MTPSPQSGSGFALPPLPDLQSVSDTGGGQTGTPPDAMAALVAGIAPVKTNVDAIVTACKKIQQSGSVPGAEQPCSQIIALAMSLLPMAAQNAMQGSPGQSASGGGGLQPVQPSGGPQ